MTDLETSIAAIRKWQRHWLLRQYGDNGLVLPENIELSEHIDRLIEAAAPRFMPRTEDEANEAMDNGRNTGGGKMRR